MDESTIYSTQRACAILLALAGMALQWAALHSITFLGTVFDASSGGASESGAWIVNSAATFVAFLALFLVARRVASLGEIRWALPAMVACLAVGTLLFVAGEAFGWRARRSMRATSSSRSARPRSSACGERCIATSTQRASSCW